MNRTRMYEPWGYQEASAYISKKTKVDNELTESKENDKKELQDIESLKKDKVDGAEYKKDENKIVLTANGNEVASIDTSDFTSKGVIKSVELDGTVLKIVFSTESGEEEVSVDLKDIFDPEMYYTKNDVNTLLDDKADTTDLAEISEKVDAIDLEPYAKTEDVNNELALKADKTEIPSVEGLAEESAVTAAIDAVVEAQAAKDDAQDAEIALKANTSDVETALSGKADTSAVYTQEEVDKMIAAKESEISALKADYKKLKEIVGDIGGAVEYTVPEDGTFSTLIKKSGIIKLTEDITTSTYTGAITAKNITNLKLNSKTLTFSGSTTKNPCILAQGKQQYTIDGAGTFNADGRIAVEANGENVVINLGGTMFGMPTYITDRSGGELIYCYSGTINITNGIFKNTGEDKTFMLNCYDANYRNGTAKIIVTGGKFYDFNPADNSAEGEHTSFVPEGYHVETSQDGESTVYTVKKD